MTLPRGVARVIFIVGASALLAWWALPRAVDDWRFQLAGLASWFFGRPDPVATIAVGVVVSTILIHLASVVHRRARAGIASALLIPLATGWLAYATGAAMTILSGGQTVYPGQLDYTFSGTLGHTATLPATCHTPVGRSSLLAHVEPTVGGPVAVGGLPIIRVRHAATGEMVEGGPELERFEIDGTMLSAFSIPSLADRPLPYMVVTAGPDGPEREPPIAFMDAYDLTVTSSTDDGFTGEAIISATRWLDLVEGGEAHWVNLTVPDDPWPQAFTLSVAWSCTT
jgi:hypothetical protein